MSGFTEENRGRCDDCPYPNRPECPMRCTVNLEAEIEGLDAGIRPHVAILREAGIETFESCQGGEGHCFPEPTVRFYGQRDEGFRALALALQRELPVANLRRYWSVEDGEPVGPYWELTFS